MYVCVETLSKIQKDIVGGTILLDMTKKDPNFKPWYYYGMYEEKIKVDRCYLRYYKTAFGKESNYS